MTHCISILLIWQWCISKTWNELKKFYSKVCYIAAPFPLSVNAFSRVHMNKPIIGTSVEILYLRQTRVSSTKDSSVTLELKKIKYEVEKHLGPQIPNGYVSSTQQFIVNTLQIMCVPCLILTQLTENLICTFFQCLKYLFCRKGKFNWPYNAVYTKYYIIILILLSNEEMCSIWHFIHGYTIF